MNVEIIGVIAALLELGGLYLLSEHLRLGFLINILSSITWITFVILSNTTYGLLLVCSIAIAINIHGIIKWKVTAE